MLLITRARMCDMLMSPMAQKPELWRKNKVYCTTLAQKQGLLYNSGAKTRFTVQLTTCSLGQVSFKGYLERENFALHATTIIVSKSLTDIHLYCVPETHAMHALLTQ